MYILISSLLKGTNYCMIVNTWSRLFQRPSELNRRVYILLFSLACESECSQYVLSKHRDVPASLRCPSYKTATDAPAHSLRRLTPPPIHYLVLGWWKSSQGNCFLRPHPWVRLGRRRQCLSSRDECPPMPAQSRASPVVTQTPVSVVTGGQSSPTVSHVLVRSATGIQMLRTTNTLTQGALIQNVLKWFDSEFIKGSLRNQVWRCAL